MFERDPYISFANCGLPYYIGDSIKDRSKLLVQTPEAMHRRFNIDVRTESEVIGIDPSCKTVRVRSKDRGEYEESYDAMILSPGAKPIRPNLPGIESSRIHTLRNIPDTDRIKRRVADEQAASAIVIGGGFIGVEMAENLKEIGLDVTLIEGGPQILAPFDPEMAGVLAKELEDRGVTLLMSQSVTSFEEMGQQIVVRTSSGLSLAGDIVILAIGVAPDTAFLKESGIELGPRGHIIVNDKLETNLEGVYAVGDAVEISDFVNGSKTAIPLAGPANKQGRIAADNVCGLGTVYKGTQGTSIIKVFGLTGASTGNNEKTLQRLGIPYHVIYVHPNSHASYYPGAAPITMKLLFQADGTLLGAQAVGYDGVDKRIDDIATVIHFHGTVTDLTELELAYAPPYSSAKDPVNMAGYTAENVLSGRTNVFVPKDLAARDEQSTLLVDVRSEIEHAGGHIPGSLLIPVDELRDRLGELDPAKEIWVYCQVGLRGYTASRILQQKGYRVRNLTGGYKLYRMANYEPGKAQLSPGRLDAVEAKAEVAAAVAAAKESNPLQTANEPAVANELLRADAELDACGLCCPGPLIQVKQTMDRLQEGQVLRVTASDPGFYEDVQAWANMSKNRMLQVSKNDNGIIEAYMRKGGAMAAEAANVEQPAASPEGTTMVVFSGDLDKAIASFIIVQWGCSQRKEGHVVLHFLGS
ncbi:CoA-disulfide reductase [Paenibacillus macerans]|nr:CoA-disulfide reductase [Paenibacillus macerans]